MAYNLIDTAYAATVQTEPQALLDAVAATFLAVLGPRGLQHSYSLPQEQVAPTETSGPWMQHFITGDPIQIADLDGCMMEEVYTIESYLFVTPLQQTRAAAFGATWPWLRPMIWALSANRTLGGVVREIRPISVVARGSMSYGGGAWTGLILTSHLWLYYDVLQGS